MCLMQQGQEMPFHRQVLVNKFTAVEHDINITNDYIFRKGKESMGSQLFFSVGPNSKPSTCL